MSHYIDCPNEPLYPFGYGLSYTSYAYSDLKLSASEMHPGEKIQVTIKVQNTGDRSGNEIVQLYLCDPCASVVRPVKELKGFSLLALEAGEKKEAVFTITEEDLMFWDNEECRRVEAGRFIVMAGPNSRDVMKAEFVYKVQ